MKDPPYMGEKKKDGTMHRQDRGMTCSLISKYIAGTGGVAEKG